MLVLSQASSGALSAKRASTFSSSPIFTHGNPSLFSKRKPTFVRKTRRKTLLAISSAEGGVDSGSTTKQPPASPPFGNDETVFVGQENVPLEGVIQFDKPSSSSRLNKWGRVALLAGGDVLALVLFSAVGRLSHGFPVFDIETLRTADPFIAGWFLSAYFLGGYGEDGRGINGFYKAIVAAVKSWSVGIPLGLIIRAATSGHVPPSNFIFVTMGSTAVSLIGCRALLFRIIPNDKNKKNDVYRRGSPFELFEITRILDH
ncbi:uncharacterized protein LOC131161625 isoform X2 [Malania oleifera]|uniref:uncharacterized protein LOC131161625 isoform X2 n=1 Tax=Malania oleifera TaxID=397392 RepID=UPI0025AE6913|nr:uncharacterized protein LOC131161625 isoform X2 [Malania oleifera]